MSDKKKNELEIHNAVEDFDTIPVKDSPIFKLNKAIIDYTLSLIEETKVANSNEKHKLTEEITKLYAVIRVPVVDGLQAQI